MTRYFCGIALLATLMLAAGCATCESCLDYGPSAFGGVCADGACGGRAGSIITPPSGEIIEEIGGPAAAPEPLPIEPVPAPSRQTDLDPPEESGMWPAIEAALAPPR